MRVPYIDQIAHANRLDREILTGPDPQILYFIGKRTIFSAKTILKLVVASRNPSRNLGGPDGVLLKNTISLAKNDQPALDRIS